LVKAAVEQLFKVKVADVRTANIEGKLRRRGRFPATGGLEEGLRAAEAGEKVPEYAEI
jgi:large subunit ribosomal protein L23